MKVRTVLITIEATTDIPLAEIAKRFETAGSSVAADDEEFEVQQVRVQVAQPPKPKKKAKR